MFSSKKLIVVAVTALASVAATAHTGFSNRDGQVLPVVSAQGHLPALEAVHYTGHRHHHRRHHRPHPVRHVR